MIKVALLTTDSREHFKDYANPNPYFGTAPEALIEGFKLLPGNVEVHIVSCLQKLPASSPVKLANNVYYHPLHVPSIGWLKSSYLGCIQAVRHKLRKINPDIVHGQGTERDCAVSAVFSGFPNVLTIHGNMRLVAKFLRAKPLTYYWFAAKLERLCLRKTSGVIAISSYTQSNVSPYTHCNWLIPNAVHPSFFDLPRKPDSPTRIFCAANVGSRKNQIGLIKALDALAAIAPIKLVFAGAGTDSDAYYRDFKKMVSDRPWCEYLGTLDRRALKTEMSRATLGVLPSFEDNCPMVILEAAAAGLPFAASAIGGIPDLIEHRATGLLFNPRQPESIRSSVESLIADNGLSEQLATSARAHAVSQFSAESVARRHLKVYHAVIANPFAEGAKRNPNLPQ
jgi:glycosyltransferase involved in cell wall biosynthesis